MSEGKRPLADRALSALLPGVLMTAYGWYAPFSSLSDSALYGLCVAAVNIALKFGGPLLILAAVLQWLERREGLWLDALASLAAGLMLGLSACYMLISAGDLTDVILLVFSVMLLTGARRELAACLESIRAGSNADEQSETQAASIAPDPFPQPARRREAQPTAPNSKPPDAAPPADGYLAALGRRSREPAGESGKDADDGRA